MIGELLRSFANKLTSPTDSSVVLDLPDPPSNGKPDIDEHEIVRWLQGGPRPTSHLQQEIGNRNGSPNGHDTETVVFQR